MTKHTPLPWKIEERVSRGIFIVGNIPDGYDKTVCSMRWTSPLVPRDVEMADAEFIVRACNSHTDLLEALERAQQVTNFTDVENWWIDVAMPAIAKAKGS